MTKDQFNALLNDTHHLALDIGLRPAARALGLSEARVMKWSSRYKWGIALIHPPGFNPSRVPRPSAGVSGAIEVKRRLLATASDRTKLGFAKAATTVAEGLSEKTYGQLIAPGTAISADQWSRVSDRVHGWIAERQQNAVQVNVAISQPTAVEREERRAMHARLDEIARRLTSSTTD